MADYIDKDKFCHFLFKEIAHVEETQTDTEIPISLVLQSVVNEVKKFPAADVQPVKHGRWVNDIQCSNCGWYMEDDVTISPMMVFFDYCPNCGAKMDGEE